MSSSEQRGAIRVWRPAGVRGVEAHRGVGVARVVARHWHEEYQLCLVEDGPGDLVYRGARHETPAASLFVVHPGEIHANHAHERRGCSYRTLLVEPTVMRRAAADVFGREGSAPFIVAPVLFEPGTIRLFARLHASLEGVEGAASSLERESLLALFAARLVERFGERRVASSCAGELKRVGVARACEFLQEHYAENVSLGQLARLVGLSPFHFSRVFAAEVGMPPHAFQTQVRVARARALLAAGWPVAQAAAQTGFADQSHLTRHFKRLTGVTPGRYQRGSKNVQDS